MNISYNDLASYKKCPLQYRWMKLGGYPHKPIDPNPRKKAQFIGYLLQGVVEKFYREDWWRTPTEVLAKFRTTIGAVANKVSIREKIVWLPGEYEHWLQVAQDAVQTIIQTIKKEKLLGIKNYVELPITVKIPEKGEVWGRSDFVLIRPDEMLLLDGKGGGTVGRYVDKEQLVVYDLGCRARFDRAPTKIGFWWFRHGKMQWVNVTGESRTKYVEEARVAMDGISQLKFEPTPGQHCRLCDFRPGCDEGLKFTASKATELPDLDIPDNMAHVSL